MTPAELRELLELAAKAVGLKNIVCIEDHGVYWNEAPDFPGLYYNNRWNPADDDGDSRRLEVALRLHILHNDPGEPVLWVSAVLNKRGLHGVAEFQDEDRRAAATRLAVLRCAAEIGRAMP